MTDIVERLRVAGKKYGMSVMREAADEIERLRAELDNHAILVEKLERQDAEIERLQAELAASKAGTDFAVEVGEEAKELLFKQRDEIERLRAALGGEK